MKKYSAPQSSCTELITLPCELVTVAHYRGMWDSPPQKSKLKKRCSKNKAVLIIMCVGKWLQPIANLLKACSCALNTLTIINLPRQWKLELVHN